MQEELKEIEIELFFNPADKIYKEHFKGAPVVPGSLIIESFYKLIKSELKISPQKVVKMQFPHFTTPKKAIAQLKQKNGKIFCQLKQDNLIKAKGIIDYET